MACGHALSMGTGHLAQLWSQNNLAEKRARKTNPHIPLLNHRGKHRLCFNAVQAQVASELELRGRGVLPWEQIPDTADFLLVDGHFNAVTAFLDIFRNYRGSLVRNVVDAA